jgi:AcrR family transcriptional regulator
MNTPDMTSIRAQYKAMTRERILDAAVDLIAKDGAALTIAAVAEHAGVTDRTIYRHFATREALLDAVWPRMQARVQSRGFPQSAQELIDMPRHLFPQFDAHQNLVFASVYSKGGREVRMKANEMRQAAMLACVDDALPALPKAKRRRRAAAVQLIDSAYAWAVMKDFWGFDGVEAGEAAAEAIAILLGRAQARHSQDKEENRS